MEKEVFTYDLIPLLCLYILTEGKMSSEVVITIALSLLKRRKVQFITIFSIQDHSLRLKCMNLSSELEKQRYGDVAYNHARDKREVWEEKSSVQVIREECGLRIRQETVCFFKKNILQVH